MDKEIVISALNKAILRQFDFLTPTEYKQQIKTLCLKYVILAGKIIKTARSVIMKFCKNYPYREVYEAACYNRS